MSNTLGKHVRSGFVSGLVAGIWRKGELKIEAARAQSFGGVPVRANSIFRLASITKPVVAAAAMILVEDGKLKLDEPVDALLPELANRRVLTSIDAPLDAVVHNSCRTAYLPRWAWKIRVSLFPRASATGSLLSTDAIQKRMKSALFNDPWTEFLKPPVFESGGAGLVSTIPDYMAFCRLMLANGEHNGKRILSKAAVAKMTENQITPGLRDRPREVRPRQHSRLGPWRFRGAWKFPSWVSCGCLWLERRLRHNGLH